MTGEVTLTAEQVEELRRLATVEEQDEWHGAELYGDLARAVLRAVGEP